MIAPGMVLIFAGYALGSWGFCLVKGWNIPLRSWMSPTHPWTWPAGQVPTVPPGQIMPGPSLANAAGNATQGIVNAFGQAAAGAQTAGNPWVQVGNAFGNLPGASPPANTPWSQIGNVAGQAGSAESGL